MNCPLLTCELNVLGKDRSVVHDGSPLLLSKKTKPTSTAVVVQLHRHEDFDFGDSLEYLSLSKRPLEFGRISLCHTIDMESYWFMDINYIYKEKCLTTLTL